MVTRLKEIMNEKGFTSVALAKAMGVTTVTVSSMITGKTQSLDNLEKAAGILGVPLWQLFVDEEDVIVGYEPYNSATIVCPKCGERISLNINVQNEHNTNEKV